MAEEKPRFTRHPARGGGGASVTLWVGADSKKHMTVGDILPDGRTVRTVKECEEVLSHWFEAGELGEYAYDGVRRWRRRSR